MPQEVFMFFVTVILIALIYWAINNITFTDNCPQCKSSKDVKRQKRSWVTKYVFFIFRLKKNRCNKCIYTFYHAFAPDL